jgi:hypothetical protein
MKREVLYKIPSLCLKKEEYKFMAKTGHPEKYNWWLNELGSLGISTLDKKD